MKKKLFIFTLLALCLCLTTACGKTKINLGDYLIEERNNLFTASDNLYDVTLSTGMRESDYNFDGIIGDKVEFGILTLARNDGSPLSNDTYSYIVTVNEESFTGTMEKSPVDNSYVVDLEKAFPNDAKITVNIRFTGYNFNQELVNTSDSFSVDKSTALSIANKELEKDLENITSDKSNKIEVVMKILKDFSTSEVKNYYWYIGTIATNGETLGILIDANSGEVIAKKI